MAAGAHARGRTAWVDDRFPETWGERLFVALLVGLPLAGVFAAIVGAVLGPAAGMAGFPFLAAVLGVGLVLFLRPVARPAPVRRQLAPAPVAPRRAFEAPPRPVDAAHACPICGTAFTPRRWNQRYCAVECRRRAAGARRRSKAVRDRERLRAV
jgi:hypothetical protein